MEKREAARQGGKVMNTGGKGGQKLERRNEKAASGKMEGKAVYHIIKSEDGYKMQAGCLTEEYIRVGGKMRQKEGQRSLKGT